MNAEIDEQSEGEPTNGVVLCIMVVAAPKRVHSDCVLWELRRATSWGRIWLKLYGFKGKSQTLSVTTLDNVTTDYLTVIEYNCRLIDCNGDEVLFKAYSLERITGAVTKSCFLVCLPRSWRVHMERGKRVDFLIGISNFSWQPVCKEQASFQQTSRWDPIFVLNYLCHLPLLAYLNIYALCWKNWWINF